MPFRTGDVYTSQFREVISSNPSLADTEKYIKWLELELTVAKAYANALTADIPPPIPTKSRRPRKKKPDAVESADGQG
jgi:hypothetical protein